MALGLANSSKDQESLVNVLARVPVQFRGCDGEGFQLDQGSDSGQVCSALMNFSRVVGG